MFTREKDFTCIPIVDMGKSDEQLIADLISACENVGFFYLSNHGISDRLVNDAITLTKKLYKLDQSKKDSLSISFSPHYRGYGRLNAEITGGVPDFKETFDLALEREPEPEHEVISKPYMVLCGPNQWPLQEDMPEFKPSMLQYMEQMQQLGYRLMRLIVKGLGLSADEVLDKFDLAARDSYALLRLLRYPPTNSNQLGVGPHVDAGFLIFLAQDNRGGLQVKNLADEWIDAPPKAGMFIVNIGEMLQFLSQDRFKATLHRVINSSGHKRISAPFFFEPRLSATFTVPKQDDKPEEIVYGERIFQVFKRSFA